MRIQFTRDLSTADALIQALAGEYDVQVLSIRSTELRERMHGVRIAPVRERPGWLPTLAKVFGSETIPPVYLSGFMRATREFNPDILVLMECNRLDLLQALRYKREHPSCRLVLWTETKRLPKYLVTRTVMRIFLSVVRVHRDMFSRVITYTDAGRIFWEPRTLGAVPVSVIPPLVDTTDLYPDPHTVWMPEGKLRIIMNARFVPFKRHEDMVAALARIKERGVPFAMTFIGSDSARRSEIEDLVATQGLQEHVTFLEPIPHEQMRELLVSHDVLVLPSYNEALGLVVPEAMSCGLPTITSDTVGANVYVKEGETGFVFPTYNHEALADYLERICHPETLRAMGARAREHFVRNFSHDVLHGKLTEALLR